MNHKKIVLILGILLFSLHQKVIAQQQMENTMSQYYSNKMLWNAAYTGADGAKIHVLQNRSWIGFDRAPILTSLSGAFSFGKNGAAGVQVISDVAGILYRTYGVLNYAYKVKVAESKNIRLGISLTFNSYRLNSSQIDAEGMMDPLVANNINSKMTFDGNFGVVYETKKFDIGLSVFRLGNNMQSQNNQANLALAQLGGVYKIQTPSNDKVSFQPIAMLRLYRTTPAVIDGGIQFAYNNMFHLMALYQSTGNIRTGVGLNKSGLGEVNLYYNTNTKIASSASQQYELGLAIYIK